MPSTQTAGAYSWPSFQGTCVKDILPVHSKQKKQSVILKGHTHVSPMGLLLLHNNTVLFSKVGMRMTDVLLTIGFTL